MPAQTPLIPMKGMHIRRLFTTPGVDPADEIAWELHTAVIHGEDGKPVFEQKNLEIPKSWSPLAANVVASKYFRGSLGSPKRESSVRHMVARVVGQLAQWGEVGGYFATPEDKEAFEAELKHLVLRQKMAFNSPVWFNVGVEEKAQCSACFINSVEDSMSSILSLAKTEGMLFKHGSGTGSNLSTLRSSKELLAGGGTASGPVSFMKGFDAFAGVIKSGGKTRRAAKMVILNAEHPDILEFIQCKALEEKKATALIQAGYDGSFNGEAYNSIFFQNSNNSVRVSDSFMHAVDKDKAWTTLSVRNPKPMQTYPARTLFHEIAKATWLCGDPGMQFDTTVNAWHTCPNSGRINASNPCSEYMFLDDSACNLASLNLMTFRTIAGAFDVEAFCQAVDITLLAMEIVVGASTYPTPKIAENSLAFRPLGLGFANLGALLLASGLPYDSEEGRAFAGALCSLMGGRAYVQSAKMAERFGPFAEYAKNKEAMLGVLRKHAQASQKLPADKVDAALWEKQKTCWEEALALGEAHGFRNAQTTVLAPTGTIGFMMDCDTTGIEPDMALVKYKKLVGGGMLKLVNQTVPMALEKLGYRMEEVKAILAYVDKNDSIEGAPFLEAKHLPVFDCAFKPRKGNRCIAPMGHLKMMAACQPFLSGAISKTVNMPHETTVEEIEATYMEAWRLGLKAVAIYRDGCKQTQPVSTTQTAPAAPAATTAKEERLARKRLPTERKAITHKFSVGGHEGYLTVGMYEDGNPGELFITMAKEGSTVSGLVDSFATAISLTLQYGVPLQVLVDKFSHTRFEPSGFTGNPELPLAKSIADYIFRWLALKFLKPEPQTEEVLLPSATTSPSSALARPEPAPNAPIAFVNQADSPPCHVCGAITVRNGACYKCLNCGSTSGCS
ncbi:MAG: vitamin B12-dependent ribonucleotide reductase [Cystobacterineae bacterium]|nr:vitamin B12-dependent ribonucleotide reductase [Cystobacterineae bacterium]